jgi:hypothetical protein
MVQVGNEINAGPRWPAAPRPTGHSSALLSHGIAGGRAADSSAQIVPHLAGSDSESTLACWYSTALADGVSFNIIGCPATTTGTAAGVITEAAFPGRKSKKFKTAEKLTWDMPKMLS